MSHRVLLLGGHGKVALHLTPKLLSRSWQVTSIIRNPDHEPEIRSQNTNQPGQLDILTRSLDDITSEQAAQGILDESKPDIVVWAAGAGGKGGASRTYAIDQDAAIHFIKASARTAGVRKFLMVSWIGSRRGKAPWWTDEDQAASRKVWDEILPDFARAKIEADECLVAMGEQRKDWQTICLRPGTLKDEPETGKVLLGKTPARGDVNRGDVAEVAARLLENDQVRGYYDLIQGEESVGDAVQRVVREKLDCFEGEDLKAVVGKFKL